jgi:multimeric flavodoxin WrbA
MKVLVVISSPNSGGLTAACGEAARQGVVDGRSPARVINLNEYRLDRCEVCGDGWGPCFGQHTCRLEDDFASLQEMFRQAEGYVWVTPVYFGEPSESFSAFFDRLRRCEATKSGKVSSSLAGKPVICIAAAGGSGNGTLSCLMQMDRLARQLSAVSQDVIAVTQKTREYQLETIHDALVAMCTEKAAQKPQEMPISARRSRRPPRGPFNRRGKGKKG